MIEHGDVRLRATSPEAIARATLAGHGVGVLPHIVARSSQGELTCVSRREVSRGLVWLVTHPEFIKSREVAGVQRFLRSIAFELR